MRSLETKVNKITTLWHQMQDITALAEPLGSYGIFFEFIEKYRFEMISFSSHH